MKALIIIIVFFITTPLLAQNNCSKYYASKPGRKLIHKVFDKRERHSMTTEYNVESATSSGIQMNFNLWAPNFGIQEFIGFGTLELNEVFKYDVQIKDGLLYMEDKPGFGVDFDEEAAKKYPYKRSYLPVNRLEDGTLWDW